MVVALPKSHSLMVPWLLSSKFSTCKMPKDDSYELSVYMEPKPQQRQTGVVVMFNSLSGKPLVPRSRLLVTRGYYKIS